MGRQYLKGAGETYPDVTRFKEDFPEPKDEQDVDDHKAAAYTASCENRLNNAQHDDSARGKDTRKNIAQIAGEM